MSSISPVLSTGLTLTSQSDSASSSRSPEKIREAATQFESLMIGQVFKTIHEDDEGWLGTGDDQSASSAMSMADDYLAQSISKGGGLGLAKMIARQLGDANAADPAQPASPTTETGD
jgi:flagellar protein FlgJ